MFTIWYCALPNDFFHFHCFLNPPMFQLWNFSSCIMKKNRANSKIIHVFFVNFPAQLLTLSLYTCLVKNCFAYFSLIKTSNKQDRKYTFSVSIENIYFVIKRERTLCTFFCTCQFWKLLLILHFAFWASLMFHSWLTIGTLDISRV